MSSRRESSKKHFRDSSSRRRNRSRFRRSPSRNRTRGPSPRKNEKKKENRQLAREKNEIKETFLDKKLEEYSIKADPDVREKTDIFSDKFDPMAFLYSDVDPPHFDQQAPAADCVEMLLAKWDREDGLVIDENVGKKKRGWKKELRKMEIKTRDVAKLREMSNEAKRAKQEEKLKNQKRQEFEENSSDSDEVDLDKLAWKMTGESLPQQRWEELYGRKNKEDIFEEKKMAGRRKFRRFRK